MADEDKPTPTATKRIRSEIQKVNKAAVSALTVEPREDNLLLWHCTVKGPVDTPYQGGTFHFDVKFPSNYPFKPPTVTFRTKLYHPGFNEEGHICIPELRDEWKPGTDMPQIFNKIMDKIAKPSVDDPFDTDIAGVLRTDKPKFTATAKEWTKKYAL